MMFSSLFRDFTPVTTLDGEKEEDPDCLEDIRPSHPDDKPGWSR